MSRNTEYIIPSTALPYLGALEPSHLDDRYLCYILYNWIETGLKTVPKSIKINFGENYFAESAILRVANTNYFLVANGKKGGSFRLYAKDKVYYDSGLEIAALSSGILDASNQVKFKSGRMESLGVMKKIKEPLMTTVTMILFKSWQFFFGRFSFTQKMVKNILRPHMISYSGGSGLNFSRIIEYYTQVVVVTDTIYGSVRKGDIILGVKASYSAVPSSKYAIACEISSEMLLPNMEEKISSNSYTIKRVFNI